MTDLKAVEPTTESMVAGSKTSPCPAAAEDPALREHADAIRGLRKKTVESVIEIGRRLAAAKKIAGHGKWMPWLEREFGWSDRTARSYIHIHELAQSGKLENFSNLSIPVSSLYLLAAPKTPDAVRSEILVRAATGEAVTADVIKEAITAKGANGGSRSVQRIKTVGADGRSKSRSALEQSMEQAVRAIANRLKTFTPSEQQEILSRVNTVLEARSRRDAE